MRDGLDVNALIVVSAQDSREWDVATEGDPDSGAAGTRPERDPGRPYLSVCAVLGYEAPYLLEWIEFHRAHRCGAFFLYNNRDREAQRTTSPPTSTRGSWCCTTGPSSRHSCARTATASSITATTRAGSRSSTSTSSCSRPEQPLPDVLAGYEQWPGVVVNRAAFGPSGHQLKPPGLVIESYLMRRPQGDRHVKSIVDPRKVVLCTTPHHFVYDSRLPVNEDRYPVRGPLNPPASLVRLRVNHYETKSLEEWRAKLGRRRADIDRLRPDIDLEGLGAEEYSLRDEAILRWAPAVREALDEAVGRR